MSRLGSRGNIEVWRILCNPKNSIVTRSNPRESKISISSFLKLLRVLLIANYQHNITALLGKKMTSIILSLFKIEYFRSDSEIEMMLYVKKNKMWYPEVVWLWNMNYKNLSKCPKFIIWTNKKTHCINISLYIFKWN